MIAILPAGGKGTRMLGVTQGGAKEALKIAHSTVLDLVLDEAFAAGASRAVVISSPDKADVETIVSNRPEPVDLLYQHEAKGLAHAICCARELNEEALILLPDTVFPDAEPAKALTALAGTFDAVILSQPVPDHEVNRYGILETEGAEIRRILEKPAPDVTPSRLAVAARYLLSPRLLRLVHEYVAAPIDEKEWDITTVLNRAVALRLSLATVTTEAKRFDCGSPEGYAEAQAYFAR